MPLEILQTTQTGYVDALTLGGPGSGKQFTSVLFAVSSPYSAKFQVAKKDKAGNVYWDLQDITAQPGQSGYQGCYGIRFKSFDSANPTTVLAVAYFADDPIPSGNLASSAQFSSSGTVTPGAGTVDTFHNGTKIGSETGIDFEDNGVFVWTTTDDPINGYVKVIPPQIVTGNISAAGVKQRGSGFTVVHAGTGLYTVTFNPVFTAIPVIVASGSDATGNANTLATSGHAVNGFTVAIWQSNSAGTLVDHAWDFIAFAV